MTCSCGYIYIYMHMHKGWTRLRPPTASVFYPDLGNNSAQGNSAGTDDVGIVNLQTSRVNLLNPTPSTKIPQTRAQDPP